MVTEAYGNASVPGAEGSSTWGVLSRTGVGSGVGAGVAVAAGGWAGLAAPGTGEEATGTGSPPQPYSAEASKRESSSASARRSVSRTDATSLPRAENFCNIVSAQPLSGLAGPPDKGGPAGVKRRAKGGAAPAGAPQGPARGGDLLFSLHQF